MQTEKVNNKTMPIAYATYLVLLAVAVVFFLIFDFKRCIELCKSNVEAEQHEEAEEGSPTKLPSASWSSEARNSSVAGCAAQAGGLGGAGLPTKAKNAQANERASGSCNLQLSPPDRLASSETPKRVATG